MLGGPALRFRYGAELVRRPKDEDPDSEGRSDGDGWADLCVGSWLGLELSSGLLLGRTDPGRLGTVVVLGLRPWLSRRQSGWFLHTERFSLIGALLPETGAAFGLAGGPHWYLGWELPLGGESVQVVPGVLWISPEAPSRFIGTLAFRVPM